MRLRVFAVLALAVGLILLLALAIAAQETGGTDANQAILGAVSAGPTASLSALQNRASLDYASALTFTPALTTYLPAVYRGHPYCATIPTLIRPADGGSLDTLIPLFTWDSGNDPNATDLYLEIWRDAQLTHWVTGLKSGARTQGIHQWRINLNLDSAATHRWRAFLMCGSTQGPYSEVSSFTTGSGGTVLPAPNLLSPANGSLLPGPGPGGTEVTLKWSSVSGAVQYQVTYLSGWFLRTTVVTGTEATLHLDLDTTYEWWVQARNDYAWSAESAHWRFTTPGLSPTSPPPTSPPEPTSSPRPTPPHEPITQGTTPVPPTPSSPGDVSWSTPSRPVRANIGPPVDGSTQAQAAGTKDHQRQEPISI
jgi:hypothetical protein